MPAHGEVKEVRLNGKHLRYRWYRHSANTTKGSWIATHWKWASIERWSRVDIRNPGKWIGDHLTGISNEFMMEIEAD